MELYKVTLYHQTTQPYECTVEATSEEDAMSQVEDDFYGNGCFEYKELDICDGDMVNIEAEEMQKPKRPLKNVIGSWTRTQKNRTKEIKILREIKAKLNLGSEAQQ